MNPLWRLTLTGLLGLGLSAAAQLQQGPGHQSRQDLQGNAKKLPILLEKASAELKERDGTLSWKALTDIKVVRHENTDGRFGRGVAYFAEPVVRADVRALEGTRVRVTGYVLPRGESEGARRILVSAYPSIDADGCTAGGNETFVDVSLKGEAVPALDTLITVEGKLAFFRLDSWSGYIYRLEDPRILSPNHN